MSRAQPHRSASVWRQCRALWPVSLAHVSRSPWTSLSVISCVMLAVLMMLAFAAMAGGYERQLAGRGRSDVALVLARDASAETSSRLSRAQVEAVLRLPGVQVASPELVMTVGLPRREAGRLSLNLRGLSPAGHTLRAGFQLTAGRLPEPGRQELLAGRRLLADARGLELGQTVRLLGRDWTVVGHFTVQAEVFEGELWADLGAVQDSYGRNNQFQAVRLGLPPPDAQAALDAINAAMAADPSLPLSAVSERDFYASQAEGTTRLIRYLAWPLSAVLAFGAVAGCFTTLAMAVQARRPGLKALHQIGFGAPAIFASVLVEALLLSLIGGLLALWLGWLMFDGVRGSGFAAGMTSLSYAWRLDAQAGAQALALAAAIGLLGGAVPAWHSLNLKRGDLP